jgi:RNA polymerase sigma factor (sigma-70 family)
MNAEKLYLDNLKLIDRIAAFVARRNHLNPDESAEFIQETRVRLLEDDYAIITKFQGRSAFSTYLTTVIGHLFHEYRVKQWGKWRPSAEAKRIGDKAVTLERMVTRDGFTFDEAVKVLTTPAGSQYTPRELEKIYRRLPTRPPRPVMVSGDVNPDVIATAADAYDRVQSSDREQLARKAITEMDLGITAMESEDRLILQMRYLGGLKVPDIARRIQRDQKWVYKRLDVLCAQLRRRLEAAALDRNLVNDLLDAETDLQFTALRHNEESAGHRPSHH